MSRTYLRRMALHLCGAVLLSACSHARPTVGASPTAQRERRVVMADGVVVTATRWDPTLVELVAAEAPLATRNTLRQRMLGRYVGAGPTFTVVVELASRPRDRDALSDPKAWWFQLGGAKPTDVELIAIDRYPTGDGRAHLRIAFDVQFKGRRGADAELRVGSRAQVGTTWPRPELGRRLATRGAALRW